MHATHSLDITRILKQIREDFGHSQEYVAIQLGISQPAYSQRESGQTEVTFTLLQRLAAMYGMSVVDLLQFQASALPRCRRQWANQFIAQRQTQPLSA